MTNGLNKTLTNFILNQYGTEKIAPLSKWSEIELFQGAVAAAAAAAELEWKHHPSNVRLPPPIVAWHMTYIKHPRRAFGRSPDAKPLIRFDVFGPSITVQQSEEINSTISFPFLSGAGWAEGGRGKSGSTKHVAPPSGH